MIDFSKNADLSIMRQKQSQTADDKKVRQNKDTSVHVNYDFENRDAVPKSDERENTLETNVSGNIKSEPVAEKKHSKFDAAGFGSDYKTKRDGFELTK